jgi:hypothetical protein
MTGIDIGGTITHDPVKPAQDMAQHGEARPAGRRGMAAGCRADRARMNS